MPGAGQDGGSRGAEARRSRAVRTPSWGDQSLQGKGAALLGVKPRCVGADRLASLSLVRGSEHTQVFTSQKVAPDCPSPGW